MKRFVWCLGCALMMLGPMGFAGAAQCSGQVTGFQITSTGAVAVDVGYGYWWLCNLNQDGVYGNVSVVSGACKGWVAVLQAAQRSGSSVTLSYGDPNAICTAAGSWVTPGVWAVNTYQ